MKEIKQRIAIAKACKVKFLVSKVCPICNGNTPYEAGDDYGITIWGQCEHCNNTGKVKPYHINLPHYTSDLNAMREARTIITDKVIQARYADELIMVLNRDHDGERRFIGASPFFIANATAAQHAEAFLKTLNLWKE